LGLALWRVVFIVLGYPRIISRVVVSPAALENRTVCSMVLSMLSMALRPAVKSSSG
jgi:hypothetical protein